MSAQCCFEIPNPKHEIRNKSKTQRKNVQNEEAFSLLRLLRCLLFNLAKMYLPTCWMTTLALATHRVWWVVSWSFGFSVLNLFRISDFELRIWLRAKPR